MTHAARPPRWLAAAVWLALGTLLVYPVHVPYQNPDQDRPVQHALLELVRGGLRPWDFQYTSALTNLLRLAYAAFLGAARLAGRPLDAIDLLARWMEDPAAFRVLPRLLAVTAGVVSLLGVARLAARVTDAWGGLIAAALLGTSLAFVREHHHGMFDAPASAAAVWALVCACGYVSAPRRATLAAAGALAGLALSFKQTAAPVLIALPIAAALARTTAGERAAALVAATALAALVLFATSPGLVLEPGRFLAHQQVIHAALSAPSPFVGNDLATALRRGLGAPLIVAGALGLVVAAARRERALAPLAGFTLAYAALVLGSTFVLNRYVLMLAPPCAVFAAVALHAILPPRPRLAAAAALVVLGLPACVAHVRLLAAEDTRVAAARWLRANVQPEASVFWPGDPLLSFYAGPDLTRPLGLGDRLPPAMREALARRLPPLPYPPRHHGAPIPQPGCAPCAETLRPYAGSIVVTAEHSDPAFADAVSSPLLLEALSRWAVPLADFPIEAAPAPRTYDRGDMNFAPLAGAATLLRAGPRLRLWYVPPPPGAAAPPSPLVPRRAR